ncbi:MAG: hypothetical protein DCC73_11830 [Proteobacteria bacterium]|nr:MAG: hypothetical protein DCC73_11830 [Pseudomonadota bacterium]
MSDLIPNLSLGVSMRGGGKDKKDKDPLEFFPTPAPFTRALLSVWRPRSPTVWEPACGEGHMADVLMEEGLDVIATDIVDRGYEHQDWMWDFLQETKAWGGALITNPPFSRSLDFMQHALDLGIKEMAFLTKIEFWAVGKNARFYNRNPPALVIPVVGRADFTGAGNPVMYMQWTVWDAHHQGGTLHKLARRIQQKELPL